jgi:hypothetical protein
VVRTLPTDERLPPRVVTVATLILVAAALACLFVASYYTYYYAWSGRRQFTSWIGALVYCILPAALTILLLLSLRLRASHRVNLALFVCSVGVSVYALEILLTVWLSLPSVRAAEERKVRAAAARAAGVEFDARSERQVVQDLVSQGLDAIPSIFPQAFLQEQPDGTIRSPLSVDGSELFPLAAIANRLVVLCNETGRFVTFRSDQHGFNNPSRLWANAPVDAVVVGDSFVHGYCVENNVVTFIREQYPTTLNLGIEGNGPLVILATIKEYARLVKPKRVLWLHYEGNDLKDLNAERESPLLRRYLTKAFSQNLATRQAQIDRALTDYLQTISGKSGLSIKLEELSDLFRHPGQLSKKAGSIMKLVRTRQRLGLVYGRKDETQAATAVAGAVRDHDRSRTALLYDVLVEAKRSVGEWGGKLYFVYLPTWDRYGSMILTRERDDVLSTAHRAGLPVVDIHSTFTRQQDPLSLFPFRLPGHYTEEGNRLVAEEILQAITRAR